MFLGRLGENVSAGEKDDEEVATTRQRRRRPEKPNAEEVCLGTAQSAVEIRRHGNEDSGAPREIIPRKNSKFFS